MKKSGYLLTACLAILFCCCDSHNDDICNGRIARGFEKHCPDDIRNMLYKSDSMTIIYYQSISYGDYDKAKDIVYESDSIFLFYMNDVICKSIYIYIHQFDISYLEDTSANKILIDRRNAFSRMFMHFDERFSRRIK